MQFWKGTIIHGLVTLAFCLVGLGWIAAVFYTGREFTQAEYRYITDHGGKRNNCPWYCGFLPESWTKKGMLDWLLPLCIATLFNL
jgi:hypothetical protein